MGLFSRLLGKDDSDRPGTSGATGDPADIRREGIQVIRADETLPITGRGLVVTGELLVPVRLGDKFDVTHRGSTELMRTTTIMVDKAEQKSAAPGSTATLLLNRPALIG